MQDPRWASLPRRHPPFPASRRGQLPSAVQERPATVAGTRVAPTLALCMRPSFCHPLPQRSTPPAPGAVGAALVVTQGRHKACPYRDMLNNAWNKTVVLTVATVLAALTGSFLIVRRAKPQGAPSSRRAFIAHGLEKHFASEGDTGPVKVNHIPTPERVMAPGLRLQPSSPPKGRRGINIVRGCPYGQKRGPGTLH